MFKLLKLCIDKKLKNLIIINMILVVVQALCDVAVPVLLVYINNLASNNNNDLLIPSLSSIANSLLIGFFIFLICCVLILSGYFGIKITSQITARISFGLRNKMYKKIQTLSLADIDNINSSSLIVRMTNDVYNVANSYLFTFRLLSKSILMFVGSLIALCCLVLIDTSPVASIVSPKTIPTNYPIFPKYTILIIILLATLALLIIVTVCGMLAKKDFIATQKNNDILNKDIEQNVVGQRVVKSYGLQDQQQALFSVHTNNLRKSATAGSAKIFIIIPSIYFILNIITVFITWFSSIELLPKFSSITTLSTLMVTSVVLSLVALINIIRGIPSAGRILNLLNYENIIKYSEINVDLTNKNNSIKLENVSFKYNQEAEYALKDINLYIKPNEVVGIIGPTASGKTTLVNLIARMYDATNGKIELFDTNVKDFPKHQLKSLITMCPQIVTLFYGTIKSNITFSKPDATENEIIQAAKDANALNFINEKELKFDTIVEQRGSNFSGGQKQRLAIARTLLKKADYLILDDSTSALDMLTEKEIQQTLLKNEYKQTILLVAQRISAVKNANRIIVMDQGKVIGFDTHINLLKNCETYRDIAISQMGMKEVERELENA